MDQLKVRYPANLLAEAEANKSILVTIEVMGRFVKQGIVTFQGVLRTDAEVEAVYALIRQFFAGDREPGKDKVGASE